MFKNTMLGILAVIAFIAVISGIGFLAQGADFIAFRFWAPKYENVKYQTFKNTQSHVESKNRDLSRYHHEWVVAKEPIEKKAIEAVIRQQFSDVQPSTIDDPDLRAWMQSCLNN